jgi:hypothetical protein
MDLITDLSLFGIGCFLGLGNGGIATASLSARPFWGNLASFATVFLLILIALLSLTNFPLSLGIGFNLGFWAMLGYGVVTQPEQIPAASLKYWEEQKAR